MPNFRGTEHTLGFKPQAAAGTPEATVTTFLSSEGLSMGMNPEPVPSKSYRGSPAETAPRLGVIKPSGKAPCEVMASQPQIGRAHV